MDFPRRLVSAYTPQLIAKNDCQCFFSDLPIGKQRPMPKPLENGYAAEVESAAAEVVIVKIKTSARSGDGSQSAGP